MTRSPARSIASARSFTLRIPEGVSAHTLEAVKSFIAIPLSSYIHYFSAVPWPFS